MPALADGGGVPAVARFVKDVALRSGCFDLKLVSLSMSSVDPCNLRLARPDTWLRGASSREGAWESHHYTHVGAVMSELEFQRYRSRAELRRAVADCDLLQVVCGSPAAAYSVCGLGKPVAVQCATRAKIERRRRDHSLRPLLQLWRSWMTAVTDRFDDLALRSVDAIQVENPWMYDYARQLNEGRAVDIRYAPPGIDAARFCPVVRDYHLDPYILCVGRLDDPRKNIGLLLEAYCLVPGELRNRLRIVFAGQAAPVATFWRRADALGVRNRITFIERPPLNDLVSLYQRACMFVLPSDEEGLGVVLLEAMGCGVPVVSTRSGGPDGIIDHGFNGYLVDLDDAPAMSNCIAALGSDAALNEKMGHDARRTIEERYAEDIAGGAFIDTWQKLLQHHKRPFACAGLLQP